LTVKLLLVTGSLKSGGAERQLMQLAAHLHGSALWDVSIAVLERDIGEGASQLPHDLPVRSVRRSNALASLLALRSMIKTQDLVYSWLDIANAATSLSAALTPTPVVWSLRGSGAETSRVARVAARVAVYLNRSTAAMVANSSRGKDYFAGRGYQGSRISVVPNGIDTKKFSPRDRTKGSSLGSAAEKVIGMVARYHPVKRHGLLLEAFADAVQQSNDPSWKLALVGAGVTDSNPELVEVIERRHLRERVLLLGPRPDVECLIPQFALAVCASEHEGTPNSLLEALACGVPVLSTAVGDVSDFLTCGGRVTGFSRSDLGDGLIAMMRMSNESRRAMGLQGRRLVEREFSLQASIAQTVSILSNCVARKA
jgi:glycosyltransferase involved in cell wall biosynthesis